MLDETNSLPEIENEIKRLEDLKLKLKNNEYYKVENEQLIKSVNLMRQFKTRMGDLPRLVLYPDYSGEFRISQNEILFWFNDANDLLHKLTKERI